MTARFRQRARILRVRGIEHKAAQMRLTEADAALLNLRRIAQRLGELKEPLHSGAGSVHGQALNAMAEMSLRIDDAHASLMRPIDDAKRNRTQVEAERILAKLREDGVAQIITRDTVSVERELERRADANRPRAGRAAGRKEFSR